MCDSVAMANAKESHKFNCDCLGGKVVVVMQARPRKFTQ